MYIEKSPIDLANYINAARYLNANAQAILAAEPDMIQYTDNAADAVALYELLIELVNMDVEAYQKARGDEIKYDLEFEFYNSGTDYSQLSARINELNRAVIDADTDFQGKKAAFEALAAQDEYWADRFVTRTRLNEELESLKGEYELRPYNENFRQQINQLEQDIRVLNSDSSF